MSVRTCTKGTKLIFNKVAYNTNHQFHVGLVSSGSSGNKLQKALLTQIKKFIKQLFKSFLREEEVSVENAFYHGKTIYIY